MKRSLIPVCVAGGAVLFTSVLLPICGSLINLVDSAINAKINRMSMALELDQREHEAAAEVIKPAPQITQAVGFQLPTQPDDEEEDY